MDETYLELTKTLNSALIESKMADDELRELRESFEAEIGPRKEMAKTLAKRAAEAKNALTEYAVLAAKAGTLDKNGPVKMKNWTSVVIDKEKALEWAKVNMPVAVIETVDEKILMPMAKGTVQDWATVTEYAKPFVASDLSQWI